MSFYPKIYSIGHKYLNELFLDEVEISEKVDGSQISAYVNDKGELHVRSKGQELILDQPEPLFKEGVATFLELKDKMNPGWVYYGEYLKKPKHNVLAYDRIPVKHVILFDIMVSDQNFLSLDEVRTEATRLGLEAVPLLHKGKVDAVEPLRELLERTSVLGGQKIEGFVVKNYKRFGLDGKVLLGKYVSEAFKEMHKKDWKESNPSSKDIVLRIAESLKTHARWDKSVIHLKEKGLLTDSPRDIGNLIKEVKDDTKLECEAEIKDILFNHAWPDIARLITNGLAQWYKDKLLSSAFPQENKDENETTRV